MTTKPIPFDRAEAEALAERFPTPFYVYDERAIRANVRRLRDAFAWNDGFREFFAVKATPNPFILKILADEGLGTDCSSGAELELSRRVGVTGEHVMFTSNNTPASEYRAARDLGAVINLDDITHIPFLADAIDLPDLISCRYNPGPLKGGNAIIGHPEEAKYGFTREQLFEGYRDLARRGVTRFGLHTMVASNELDPAYFVETAVMLFELIGELSAEIGIRFEFVNLGGGIGIPYHPEQDPIDLAALGAHIHDAYNRLIAARNLAPLKVYLECGRMITGPYGYLVTRVIHTKHTYKDYVGVDACMANLMRPGMYGAYHHITVLGKEAADPTATYDVTGSLCENNDKFAIDRALPPVDCGDLIVIHDAGAHGHAMGFNYNGKLRSTELLLREDGTVVLIRRAETLDDHFATLDFDALDQFRA